MANERCKFCDDKLRWHVAGWLHESNGMATCLLESERQQKVVVAEPIGA